MPRTGKTKTYSPCVLNTDHRAPARVPQDSVMQASHSKQAPKQRRGDKNTTCSQGPTGQRSVPSHQKYADREDAGRGSVSCRKVKVIKKARLPSPRGQHTQTRSSGGYGASTRVSSNGYGKCGKQQAARLVNASRQQQEATEGTEGIANSIMAGCRKTAHSPTWQKSHAGKCPTKSPACPAVI